MLTVSDGVTHGTRADESGDLAQTLLTDAGYDVVTREVVPDERALIEETLVRLAAGHALIVTTGGTRVRASRRDAGGDQGGARP